MTSNIHIIYNNLCTKKRKKFKGEIQMKKTILIDFDNTLVNSAETIFEIYKKEKNIIDKEYHRNYLWNFKGLIDEDYVERAVDLFGEKEFFNDLQLYPDAYRVVQKLSRKYHVRICSVHKMNTSHRKVAWIRKNLPFIPKEDIVILPYENGFDKSCVQGEIIIDDKVSCIRGNRELKILYGNYKYNQYEFMDKEDKMMYTISNNILRAENWKVIESMLL